MFIPYGDRWLSSPGGNDLPPGGAEMPMPCRPRGAPVAVACLHCANTALSGLLRLNPCPWGNDFNALHEHKAGSMPTRTGTQDSVSSADKCASENAQRTTLCQLT